jgi:hypothetical protein
MVTTAAFTTALLLLFAVAVVQQVFVGVGAFHAAVEHAQASV